MEKVVEANLLPKPVETTNQQEDFSVFPDQEANQPSMFPDPQTEIAASPYTDRGTDNQAVMSALAVSRNSSSDEAFSSIVNTMKDTINRGQQPIVRDNIAVTKQNQEQKVMQAVQNDFIQNPNQQDYKDNGTSIIDLINHQYETGQKPPDQDSLEDEAVTHMQNLGAGDTAQNTIMQDILKKGNGLQIVHDHGTKISLLSREFDKMSKDYENEGLLEKGADILGTLVPLRTELSGLDTSENSGTLGRIEKLANPGKALQTEIDSLMLLPLDQFKAKLPEVIAKIKSNSGLYPGVPNLVVARDILSHYVGGLSDKEKTDYNTWAAVDAAGTLPVGAILGIGKAPAKMLNMMGNRATAVEIASQDVMKAGSGLSTTEGPIGDVLGRTGAVEESLPSAVVPKTSDLVRPYVGTSSDIADKIDAIHQGVQDVQANLNPVSRMAPGQMADAISDAIKKAELKFKDDNIVDFDQALPREPGSVTVKGYHGTASDFANYDTKLAGSATSAQDAKASGATFFSSDPEVASGYAEFASRNTAGDHPGANVRPVKIDLKRPKIIDWEGQMYSLTRFKKLIPEAKAAGHDGVIIKNVNDSVKGGPRNSDIYAVFNPNETTSPLFGGAVKSKPKVSVPKNEGDILGLNAGGQLPNPPSGVEPNDISYSDLGLDITPPSAAVPEHDFRPVSRIPGLSVSTDRTTGIANLEIYLGRKSGGGGYVSRLAATNGATRRGFSLADVEIHQNVDGQYFIKVRQPISETGVATPVLSGKDFHVGNLTHWLKSPTSALPDEWGRALINSNMNQAVIQKKIIKPLANNISKTTSKKTLSTVIDLTQQNQKWFNTSDLAMEWERAGGRPMTDKDAIAYYSYKELNDFNWTVFNRDAYVTRARRGMQTVRAYDPTGSFDTLAQNGYVVENPDFNSTRIFDVEAHKSYKEGSNTRELQKKFDTGSYHVLKLEGQWNYNDEPIRNILVKKGDTEIGPLNQQQIGYVAGGSREYPSKYFVKQAVNGKFKDGTPYVLDDMTHITANTKSQATRWANQMEAARLAWVNQHPAMDEIIARSPVENIEKWKQMVDEGLIREDTPFEVVFDKERTKAARPPGATDWANYDMSPADNYFQSKGRMYYSAKGDRLKDPEGNYATILDPMKTLGRASNNAARTMAFSDYSRKVIDEWSRVALPYVDKSSVGGNLTPDKIFFSGKLRPDTPQDLVGQLEGARKIHNRFLSLQTPEQRALDWNMRKLSEFVDGSSKAQQWAATKVLNSMSRNPIEAVNGFVFDSLFGMYNPRQLLVQTQTAAAAIIANPTHGLQAALSYCPIRMAMINKSENLLDWLEKGTRFLHGLDPQEWKLMVRTMRDNGFMEVGGNVVQLGQYNNRLYGNMLSRSIAGAREAGRFMFYEAERINRAVAYQIAWKEVKERLPELGVGTQDFLDHVLQRADDWAMNMTTASQAAWQKGAWNIPTKYMGYQARLAENLLGGNKRFTTMQRAKLIAGQFAMYGTAGIPAADWAFNWVNENYFQHNNQQMSPEMYRAWSKGGWDSLMYGLSGGQLDTDFAYTAGTGAAWSQLYQRLSSGEMSSFFDVMGGPSWEISGNTYEQLMKAVSYFKAEQHDIPDAQTWALFANDVAKTFATYRYATKAYTVYKLGYVKDKNGHPLVPATQLEAIAAGLGIPLRGETQIWDEYSAIKNRETIAEDVGKQMADLRRKSMQAITEGDVKAQTGYNNQAAATMAPYRDDPLLQQAIVQQANKQSGFDRQTTWDSMAEKFMNNTGTPPPGGPLNGGKY